MKSLILFCMAALIAGCAKEPQREFPTVKKLSEYKQTNFAATPQEKLTPGKNSIYSVPLLLAWQEIKEVSDGDLSIDAGNNLLKILTIRHHGKIRYKRMSISHQPSLRMMGL